MALWSAEQREWLAAMGHVPLEFMPLPDDPLLHALLRAAGCEASSPEAMALSREVVPARLRGDAGAKRALWPRLRALRRRSVA